MSDNLEEYLLILGKMAVFIQLFQEEQNRMANTGILTDDERELSESIGWLVKKLMISIDDQVRMVGERTPETWEDTLKKIREKLNG